MHVRHLPSAKFGVGSAKWKFGVLVVVEGAKAGVLVAWGGGRGKAVVLVDVGAKQKCEG